jgi:hypothetical protein
MRTPRSTCVEIATRKAVDFNTDWQAVRAGLMQQAYAAEEGEGLEARAGVHDPPPQAKPSFKSIARCPFLADPRQNWIEAQFLV